MLLVPLCTQIRQGMPWYYSKSMFELLVLLKETLGSQESLDPT